MEVKFAGDSEYQRWAEARLDTSADNINHHDNLQLSC
jgi:hypothetical protein